MAVLDKYNLVKKYTQGKEVVAYDVQKVGTREVARYSKEAVIFMIARKQIENCTAQVYNDDILLRGVGISLNQLPSEAEACEEKPAAAKTVYRTAEIKAANDIKENKKYKVHPDDFSFDLNTVKGAGDYCIYVCEKGIKEKLAAANSDMKVENIIDEAMKSELRSTMKDVIAAVKFAEATGQKVNVKELIDETADAMLVMLDSVI